MIKEKFTKEDIDNIFQIQKRISIVFSISGIVVTIINILLGFFVSQISFIELFTNNTVYLTLALTIPFIIFSYIPRSSYVVQLVQVLVLFTAFSISVWDQYNGIYGLTFSILAIALMYKYRMLEKRFITKILILYFMLIVFIGFSAWHAGRMVAGLQVVMFMTFFLFICYMVFKSEMDKIISNEKRMKNEILNLVIDRDKLKDRISESQKQFEELEKQYIEFKSTKEPFDFEKCNLTPSEINVIRVLVKFRASNKEISEQLNIKESTVKQHLYRIFNKIGVDNRIQLIDLCEYNFT
ncbi:LuxR C-terminal-related transcriptional regulator [Spirochaeta isovalerica]|uniref:DNA-binding CsgD family transcriptional regulator n=1 Tax=Spirochaeta isovalerica TaxID=150 RepID=A0A841R6P6_9SPIO|nr:LuxR C-terminal-related transcriptional regulator [Spirochaeta isovalerica]MBB6479525.1 DNA-binding CsgD family transcriptional regulator [Spirochaeta isovalerica]